MKIHKLVNQVPYLSGALYTAKSTKYTGLLLRKK